MVDPASHKVLPVCRRSGVATAVGSLIGGKCLIEVVMWLGRSTDEVSSLTTIEALPINGVLHLPLIDLLSLHILTSRISRLESIGALDELAVWSFVAMHGGLRPLLELGSWLLLHGTLDRSYRCCTKPMPGVVAVSTLALLLTLVLHDLVVVF
jgi:hypothetical protein